MAAIAAVCAGCGKDFSYPAWRKLRRYCSHRCYLASPRSEDHRTAISNSMRGRPPNNPFGNGGATKGRKASGRQLEGLRSGHIWMKSSVTHGDGTKPVTQPGYAALHSWVRRNFVKPVGCEQCDSDSAKKYDWALRHGCAYTRDRSSWLYLCRSCHLRYDREEVI